MDLETRSVVDTSYHGIPALFGLQYEARTLYGLAGDDVYEIDPDSGESELIYTLPISGSVNGAATLAGVTVEGTRREDTLIADVGGSTLMGLKGGDILIGSDAADTLIGGKGRDYLFGDGGRDKLKGDQGRDTLDGGRGKDTLIGGAGKDVFVFETGDGSDRIRDFEDDVDTIEIEAAMMGRGAKKIGRLLSDFGEIDGGDAVLDFGRKGGNPHRRRDRSVGPPRRYSDLLSAKVASHRAKPSALTGGGRGTNDFGQPGCETARRARNERSATPALLHKSAERRSSSFPGGPYSAATTLVSRDEYVPRFVQQSLSSQRTRPTSQTHPLLD